MTDRPAAEPQWVARLNGAGRPGAPEPELLGGKGAALDRLIGWGKPVPPTAVVATPTTSALLEDPAVADLVNRIRAGDVVAAEEVDSAFLAADLPTGFRGQLRRTIASLGVAPHGSLAVRSSATVEDLAASSFAGQYRSLLGVPTDDVEEVERAIRLVAASLWHPAACSYRQALGVSDDGAAMAVVLMPMIDAVHAGVIFTVDPAGDQDMARIEWVDGVAEDLVSGRRTPEAVLVRRDGMAAPASLLDDEGARMLDEVLHLAIEVEGRAGCPQDIEWAWDGQRVWLVQARPITVDRASVDDPFDDPAEALNGLDLTTAGIGEMLPGVLGPLLWDINSHLVEEAFRTVLAELGVLPADLVGRRGVLRRVRGRAAMDFDRIAVMAGSLPGSSAATIEAQYFGSGRAGSLILPPARRTHSRRRHLIHDLKVASLRHRSRLSADVCIEAVRAIVDDELAWSEPASAGEIMRRHVAALDLAGRLVTAELAVAADAAACFHRLERSLARWFDASRAASLAADLTRTASLTSLTTRLASAAIFAGPTWIELDDSTVRAMPSAPNAGSELTADASAVNEVAARDHVDAALRKALESAGGFDSSAWTDRLRLRSVRLMAQDASAQLERRERAKAALLALGGVVRRLHLTAGNRLVQAGALTSSDEIELLTVAEWHEALTGGRGPSSSTRARRRRNLRAHEAEGPLPMRFIGRPEPVLVTVPQRDRLEGWPASPGVFSGIARVVSSPHDAFGEDEVLVAVSTDPSWSALFARAGAIVLERGGPLSHAAILARELGVPAVLNVPHAVVLLAGRRVVVDGGAGIVAIVDPETATPQDAGAQAATTAPTDEPILR